MIEMIKNEQNQYLGLLNNKKIRIDLCGTFSFSNKLLKT